MTPILLFLLHFLPAPAPTHPFHSPASLCQSREKLSHCTWEKSVILSAGDNKNEAPVAGVAVTDTKLGAQSLLMTQGHGLYFSQELMERVRTSSFPSQMCPIWWPKSRLESLSVPTGMERELLPVTSNSFIFSSLCCRDWNSSVSPLSFLLPNKYHH